MQHSKPLLLRLSILMFKLQLDRIKICYSSGHHPLKPYGPSTVEKVDLEKPANKLIRAVLRKRGLDPKHSFYDSIHRCDRDSTTEADPEELDSGLTLKDLRIRLGDTLFIRKREEKSKHSGASKSECLV